MLGRIKRKKEKKKISIEKSVKLRYNFLDKKKYICRKKRYLEKKKEKMLEKTLAFLKL